MKLYQTKTIEDFNDLISKLYEEGYNFKDGTPLNFWSLYGCQTGIEFKKFKVGESSKIEKRIYLHNVEYYAVLKYNGVEEILEYKTDLGAKVTFKRGGLDSADGDSFFKIDFDSCDNLMSEID